MTQRALDFNYLRTLVFEQSGVVLEAHKDYLAELHLDKLATQTGFESIAAFTEHLKTIPLSTLHTQAVEALLISETSFFRDHYPFEALCTSILPPLIQSRSSNRMLNIWSAGCSTGQEPYSIAMLIRESFPELANWTVRLIASDLSTRSLDRARQGIYSNLEINRGLTPVMRDRYFHKTGQSWQINDDIRQMVEFQQLNLLHSWDTLPELDVIFLRNVLIYFNSDTKQSILNKVQRYLREDGFLFLGSGETTFYLDPRFEAVHGKTSLYHRLRNSSQ
ncbi:MULTISPECIES: protein-glutamate O-methyltransferase CheR [unclassified Leptolyngbya]|uniref:CheR family methyltransferase n=1 Tax=unclassified Leptolyngbya TaxID=2650499 RepID=UPI001682DFB0|nr:MULTISPECIES: protein-glutamate O-methyltransferase CheR [unclassified Leptolyngbya]MBD1913809.1 protein-glutamate O-methyltransferase CheR [Leptolyngbya sp. FACHB-8]MBD2156552.1 protein-glutamate O-methyltransferase CheR [Leptolyngbya sp. FACHB-16]